MQCDKEESVGHAGQHAANFWHAHALTTYMVRASALLAVASPLSRLFNYSLDHSVNISAIGYIDNIE